MAAKKTGNVLHIISHTHWDREWYLPFERFRMKLVDLIDNLLDILKRDRDFKYFHLDAQTIVLEDYAAVRPDRYPELLKHIRSGRVLVGPWYQQNDEFLTTGESTVRNLLIGSDLARQAGGCMAIGYVPDQFGHISQLPQILNQFGIDNAIMGRGRHVRKGDKHEFRWIAPDGSEVLVSYMMNWYNNAQRFPEDPASASAYVDIILGWKAGRTHSKHLLLMNGVDHLEAQENLSPILKRLQKDRPELDIRHSTLPAYIDSLRKDLKGKKLQVINGELRQGTEWHLLGNTASSHVEVKDANIRTSVRLERVVEPFTALERLLGYRHLPAAYLTFAWKRLMENHPHDSICTCSHDGVIEDMMNRYSRVNQILDGLQEKFEERFRKLIDPAGLDGEDQSLIVFNPNPQPRSAVVRAEVDFLVDKKVSRFALESPEGEPVPYSIVGKAELQPSVFHPINLPGKNAVHRTTIEFLAENTPAMGYAAYVVRANGNPGRAGRARKSALRTSGEPVMENEFLRVTLNANGSVDIRNKETRKTYRQALILEDGGDRGDAYNYHRPRNDERVTTHDARPAVRCLRQDEAATVYKIDQRLRVPKTLADPEGHRRSKETTVCPVALTLTLRAGARELEVEAQIVNYAKWHRLRVLVPTNLGVRAVRAGSAFDVIHRPARRPEGWSDPNVDVHTDMNLFFVDVSARENGLALFNQGLHEYELLDDRAGTLALTLLRATGIIHGQGNADDAARPDVDWLIPGCQCPGERTVRFALHPHGGVDEGTIYNRALAWLAPMPVTAWRRDHADWACGRPCVQETHFKATFQRPEEGDDFALRPRRLGLLSIDGPGVVLSAVKPSLEGNDVIVRVFNPTRRKAACAVILGETVQQVDRADLAENAVAKIAGKTTQFKDTIGPGEIVTWRIRP